MNKRRTQSGYTEGPWIFDEIDEEGHFDVYNSSKSTLICTGAGFYGGTPPSEANARLIASAPELLEALEALLESAKSSNASLNWATGLNDEPASFGQARAAIRKARGE